MRERRCRALALANRVVGSPHVASQDSLAVGVTISPLGRPGERKEALRVTVWNKADVVGPGGWTRAQAEALSASEPPPTPVGASPAAGRPGEAPPGPMTASVGLVRWAISSAVQLRSGLAIDDVA